MHEGSDDGSPVRDATVQGTMEPLWGKETVDGRGDDGDSPREGKGRRQPTGYGTMVARWERERWRACTREGTTVTQRKMGRSCVYGERDDGDRNDGALTGVCGNDGRPVGQEMVQRPRLKDHGQGKG